MKKNYKTLKGLLSQTLHGEINFNDFRSGRVYHKDLGLIQFTLPLEERMMAYRMFANVVWKRGANEKVHLVSHYGGKPHGILNNLVINLERWRGEYSAGQDYVYEMNIVRGIFRNGN